MKRAIAGLLVIIVVTLPSCASLLEPTHFRVPAERMQVLQDAEVRCKSFSEMTFMQLQMGKSLSVKIDTTFPAYKFETGKSFYLAYKLPETDTPYELEVRSYFMGTVFFPSMLVLNSEFKATRFITSPEFCYQGGKDDWRGWIGGTVAFPAKDLEEKYAIILTTTELMSEAMATSQRGYAYWTPGGASVNPGGQYVNHFGPTGNVKITTRARKSM